VQLGIERGEVLVHRHLAANRDGEIAVRAAARAEGDVDIDVTGHIEISPFVQHRAARIMAMRQSFSVAV
jgi:hypothetical protein